MRELIANDAGEDAILKAALEGGMKYMGEDGIDKINQGITTIDELFRVVHLLWGRPSIEMLIAKFTP